MPTANNQLAPTNEFLNFLMEWLDAQALPTGYVFTPAGVGEAVYGEMVYA